MKFMLIHALDETVEFTEEWDSEAVGVDAWLEEMTARGHVLDGARLRPPADATVVRKSADGVEVLDGPFAETKEMVAGYDVVECADRDAALAIAAAHPTIANGGSIEVRPFGPGMPTPEVPAQVADGSQRYLLMVAADMASYESFFDDVIAPGGDQPMENDPDDDIEVWLRKYAGERIYGWELTPSSQARTVRREAGRTTTVDGPFAESKEQICGFDLLECTDLDQAIRIATDHPVGTLEIRPLWS